jgi:hypothetical protein
VRTKTRIPFRVYVRPYTITSLWVNRAGVWARHDSGCSAAPAEYRLRSRCGLDKKPMQRQDREIERRSSEMAETKGGAKFNRIPGYTKQDGTKVKPHVRSNPNTSKGKAPPPAKKKR